MKSDVRWPTPAHAGVRGFAISSGVLGGLVLLVLIAFWPTLQAGFLQYDDTEYVLGNPILRDGLTRAGLLAALDPYVGYWIPVTWLSYLVDIAWFGWDAEVFHRTNLLLHAVNALLLFAVLRSLTGRFWPAVLATTLFAVHPLRVESVAWVTERKDVLSGFFFLLCLASYARYVKRQGPWHYGLVVLCLVLGLLSKPILVVVPFLLLLVDWWPSGRCRARSGRVSTGGQHVILEKLPLLAIAVLFAGVTLWVQGNAIASAGEYPLGVRLESCFSSYFIYVFKTLWPLDLALEAFHGVPEMDHWKFFLSGISLLAISVASYRLRHGAPYILFGWVWYVLTLFPVSGVVQAGVHLVADRFTYLPHIGLFVALSWGLADTVQRWQGSRTAVVGACIAVVCALTALATVQSRYWRDTETLFRHTLAVNPKDPLANHQLGVIALRRGEAAEAVRFLNQSLESASGNADAWFALGLAQVQMDEVSGAEQSFWTVTRLRPGDPDAHYNLAVALANRKEFEQAIEHYQRSLLGRPSDQQAHYNLALLYLDVGEVAHAERHFQEVLKENQTSVAALLGLAALAESAGRNGEAIDLYSRILSIAPDEKHASDRLGALRASR
ncbi:MAG: tetratricopeptide repeat protein [Deferrisomatales bacterium]|nr:tetratricopeptide repeat protein [Deferrisomatales bacterium]